jgi:hypothetical protein
MHHSASVRSSLALAWELLKLARAKCAPVKQKKKTIYGNNYFIVLIIFSPGNVTRYIKATCAVGLQRETTSRLACFEFVLVF